MSTKSGPGPQTTTPPPTTPDNGTAKPRGAVVSDPLLIAMNRISKILGPLTPSQRRRAIGYFNAEICEPPNPMPNLSEKPA